jgi:hypothetical protein
MGTEGAVLPARLRILPFFVQRSDLSLVHD